MKCFQSVALRREFHSFCLEDISGIADVIELKLEDREEAEVCSDFSFSLADPLSVSFGDPEDHGGHRMTGSFYPVEWVCGGEQWFSRGRGVVGEEVEGSWQGRLGELDSDGAPVLCKIKSTSIHENINSRV